MTELNEMRLTAVMPATPKEVYAALTDAAALRVWLADHAEVDLPDRYEFWGRYVPDGAEARQRVLYADESSLRFAWTVDGVETTVGLTVAENDAEDGGALLTLAQTHLPSFAEILSDQAGPRGELQTFWTHSLGNLVDYLSGRELTPKCDYTSTDLSASVVIDAPPAAVFDSLTQAEQFSKWSGAHVDIEPHVGGRFAMGGFDLDPGGMKFVEFEPGRKATLRFADGLLSSWELEDSQGQTRITFVQSGFDAANPPYPGWAGWLAGVGELRRYHELAQWRPIWRAVEFPGVPEEMMITDAS